MVGSDPFFDEILWVIPELIAVMGFGNVGTVHREMKTQNVEGVQMDLTPGKSRMLHLYLRHPRAPQTYENDWASDVTLRSITTYKAVADRCLAAMQRGEKVRVHRRKFGSDPAVICCECSVKSVERFDDDGKFRVEFHDWSLLHIVFKKFLMRGYYLLDPRDPAYPQPAS